jgi:hypothetical protein
LARRVLFEDSFLTAQKGRNSHFISKKFCSSLKRVPFFHLLKMPPKAKKGKKKDLLKG